MPDLLFEVGTEEMPALEAPRLAEELTAEAERAFSAAAKASSSLPAFKREVAKLR